MARSVLRNAFDFQFKGLSLNGSVESWSDDLPIRLATYQYLKKDGAEVEPMGAGPKAFSFRCAFIGADCGERYKALAASIQAEPRGLLVHPRLGQFQAACSGLKASENPATALDVVEFSIDFIENQLDQSLVTGSVPSVYTFSARLQDALTRASNATQAIVQNRIANLVFSAAVVAVQALNQLLEKLDALCIAFAQTTPDSLATDPTLISPAPLDKMLGQAAILRDDALRALTATLTVTLESDISLTDARTAVYLAYAQAEQEYRAALAQRVPVVPFTVPSAMPLHLISVRLYGQDAQKFMSSFYALNRIRTPHWVPGGTVLQVLRPGVRQ